MKKFTICCLFYGENAHLAERLLGSLRRTGYRERCDVRIGLNNVSSVTQKVVNVLAGSLDVTDIYKGEEPYHKYPMMRQMIHGTGNTRHGPIETPYTIWFDDDSWLIHEAHPVCWFDMVEQKLHDHDLIGAPYFMHLRGMQHQFVEDQPWYNGKEVKHRQKVSFITGGWWATHTGILQKHDWPPANFEHNGGDVMTGELCRQHGYKLGKFTTGLAINADHTQKCSSAKRRGFSQTPIGVKYVRPKPQSTPTLFDILDGDHAT